MTAAIRARLRTVASRVLPPEVKRELKRLVRAYHHRFFAFTPADLQERGSRSYGPVFDARHTVSRMGLITEVLRRAPGVVRSVHPTHSVAVWGSRADTIIAGHELAETPCGRLTPYGKLLDYDGKILLAGVPPSTMTFCYFVAEDLEPRLTVPVLTPERYPMRWKDQQGTVRVSNLRLFSPRLDHDLSPLVGELKRRNAWRERRVGSLRLMLLRARDVYDAAVALAARGMFVRERAVR